MIAMKLRWVMAIFLLSCFHFSIAFGCMYTVRDAGFVDIGDIPYRLYYYIREDTPKEFTSTFKKTSYAAFIDSNVEVEIINVDQQNSSRAMEYLHFWEIKSFPAAVLVSPEGQSLVLPISAGQDLRNSLLVQSPNPNESFVAEFASGAKRHPEHRGIRVALESVVSSPKREEILQHIIKSYCVVLLIQGKEADENKRVQEVVAGAIEEIAKMMSQMTKSIKEPPRLIVIPPELFSQERILLWSLGVNENEMSEPYVVILYGRGRRIGPLLKGEAITESGVFNILSVIGSACECGLDRRWVMGALLPLRWGEKVQSEVVKLLGFDAESPIVKTQISQIISLGPSSRTDAEGTDKSLESALYGYKEETVEFESEPAVAMISPAQFRELDSTKPDSSGDSSNFRMALFIVGGMVLLILAGGIFIILRARRRAS